MSRSTNKTQRKRQSPRSVADLAACPTNPRTISPEALAGLGMSVTEFGDIAGITWNKRTGHLITGHQRLEALRMQHGDSLTLTAGAIETPHGQRFPIRVVDWPAEKADAAMVAANNAHIAGDYVPEAVARLCAELSDTLPADLFHGLDLDKLLEDYPGEPEPGLTDPDDIPEPPDNATTRPGGTWGRMGHALRRERN